MQVCTPCREPRQHPTTQFFTGRMPFLTPNQQRQSTEGTDRDGQSNQKANREADVVYLSTQLTNKGA